MAVLAAALVHAASAVAQSSDAALSIEPDLASTGEWNAFVRDVWELHRRQLEGREFTQTERIGGYHRRPQFYREVTFRERDTGRVLSRVQWERRDPDRLHSIEVYVYDAEGRIARDYGASYLPDRYGAPVQTLINLHAYNGGLHAFRQFDASGFRTYEDCEGTHKGRKVDISLDEMRLIRLEGEPDTVMTSHAYRACFGDLPPEPGTFLTDPR